MRDKTVYFSLGSNLGDRRKNLSNALEALEKESIRVAARSSIYETEPQDVPAQPWFLNQVAECETSRFPLQLLAVVQRVERELGRTRTVALRRGPRIIDIDILVFGDAIIDMEKLTIPHPRMLERRFVLEPLLEIAPGLRHPGSKEPLERYLARVRHQILRKV